MHVLVTVHNTALTSSDNLPRIFQAARMFHLLFFSLFVYIVYTVHTGGLAWLVTSLVASTKLINAGPVSTWMGDRLQTGKPSWYVASHPGQLSLAIPP